MASKPVTVGCFVCCSRMATFPHGKVLDIGPELVNPNKGDRYAYVQFRDWRVVPVLLSTLVPLDVQLWK